MPSTMQMHYDNKMKKLQNKEEPKPEYSFKPQIHEGKSA